MPNEHDPQDKLTTGVCPQCYGMRVAIEARDGRHMAACETCGFTYPVQWGDVVRGWPRDMLTDEQLAEVGKTKGAG